MMMETILSRSMRLMFTGSVALGLGMLTSQAYAQVAATTDAPAATSVQRVEITGSSIKRVDAEGSLPVQVITRGDIDKLGVTNTEALLATLSSNSSVGGTFSSAGAGAATYGIATASLRGLGANKTLILVNGKRLANYATDGTSVDINSIPLSIIDHVEVLKDGASGVYGSDAIAGVINFITRKNFTGVELAGTTGVGANGGGGSSKFGVTWGFGDIDTDRYNIMLSADLGKDNPIYGNQRSYANRSSDEINGLYDNSATPSGALRTFDPNTTPNANNAVLQSLNSQGKRIGNPLAPSNCAQNGSYFDKAFGTCRFNAAPLVPLTPDVQRQNYSANMRFKLNDQAEFYVDSFISRTLTKVNEQPSPYSVSFLAQDTQFAAQNIYPAIILSPSNPNYPTTYLAGKGIINQPVTVSYRAFDGGGRDHTDTSDQIHLVAGFRGTVKNFDYDVSFIHNSSAVSENTLSGYQSMTKLVSLLSNNNAFNPFSQYQSAALAAQIKGTNYIGNMITSTLYTDSVDGQISGDLFKLPAGMASFAVGGVVRNENMDYAPSAAFQSGDISGYGGQALPFNVSRHSESVFGELAVPLLSNLDADLAVRTDKYPTVTSTNPKLSLRFKPVSQLLFRASYGTGFREASLPELYTPQTFGTSGTFTDPVTGVKNQFSVTSGGNPNLQPEKSKQWSIGAVADLTKDLSLTIDYWNIRITKEVAAIGAEYVVDQAAAGNSQYTGLVSRDSAKNITNIQSVSQNIGGVNTAGIDLDVKWKILKSPTFGNFGTRLNGTYTKKFDQILPDGTVQPSVGVTVDSSGNPLNAVSSGGILFKWKSQLAFDWSKDVYSATLAQNYQSGYYDNWPSKGGFSTDSTPRHIGSLETWDLQGAYTGIKQLTLRVGVKNMFNKQPPVITGLGNYFQSGYDPSYYDAHGRNIYVSGNYKF